jgi:effector-binding domain-containing protein
LTTAFRKVAIVCGVVPLLAIVVGVFLPSGAQVQREALIDAPAATVFVLADEPSRLVEWLPWIGPTADIDVDEDAGGRPESMRWEAGGVGAGRLIFVDSTPYERVTTVIEPWGGRDLRSTIVLESHGESSRVRWTVQTGFGINLPARYGGLWFESTAGETIERGLKELATLAESLPRADWSDIDIERLTVEAHDIAYLRASSLPDAGAISEAMGEAYFDVLGFIDRHGLAEAGPPLSISRRFSGSELVFDAAIPIRGVGEETPRAEDGIRLGETWGGPVVRGRHIGSYRTLSETHEKIAAWLAVHGITRAGDAWESYVSDPTRTPEALLVTDVYYPIEAP